MSALLLIVFLVPVTLMMHAFWKETDPQAKQAEQVAFNKNLALIGAALIVLWLAHQAGDFAGALPYTLTGNFF